MTMMTIMIVMRMMTIMIVRMSMVIQEWNHLLSRSPSNTDWRKDGGTVQSVDWDQP